MQQKMVNFISAKTWLEERGFAYFPRNTSRAAPKWLSCPKRVHVSQTDGLGTRVEDKTT